MTTKRLIKTDLETITSYYAACSGCGTATIGYEDWYEALEAADAIGLRTFRGYVACKDCVDSAIKRGIEND